MGAKTAEAEKAGHDNLQCYETEGEAMLEKIVMVDKTWVHHYQLETM